MPMCMPIYLVDVEKQLFYQLQLPVACVGFEKTVLKH